MVMIIATIARYYQRELEIWRPLEEAQHILWKVVHHLERINDNSDMVIEAVSSVMFQDST